MVHYGDSSVQTPIKNNTEVIASLSGTIDDLESLLQCSGSGELDVCGCDFGYIYYHGDCVANDENAARHWIAKGYKLYHIIAISFSHRILVIIYDS